MKKFGYFLLTVLVVGLMLLSVGFEIISGLNSVRNTFGCERKQSTEKEVLLLCVEFKSDIDELSKIAEEINNALRAYAPCTSWESVDLDGDRASPPEASAIWGFYRYASNGDQFDLTLPEMMNLYYDERIGRENSKQILEEIESWLNHPQMPSDEAQKIRSALGQDF